MCVRVCATVCLGALLYDDSLALRREEAVLSAVVRRMLLTDYACMRGRPLLNEVRFHLMDKASLNHGGERVSESERETETERQRER